MALAFSESLPAAIGARGVLGLGDAFTFISVLRVVPHWFGERQVPLVSQLTGICGQLGQVLSAVPFLGILGHAGWSAAYLTHMGTQFSVTVFALMWGIPYLTEAQALSRDAAGALLTVSVAAAIASGIVIGIVTGYHPHRRSRVVLGIMASNALAWAVVLGLPDRGPVWLLVVLIVVISAGGPGSMVGFDFARTFNPSKTLGTATGIVNMGGFIASLLVMRAMGLIIESAGGYSFASFRPARTVQYAVWALAAVGILVTRRKARRTIGDIEESKYLLEFFDEHRLLR